MLFVMVGCYFHFISRSHVTCDMSNIMWHVFLCVFLDKLVMLISGGSTVSSFTKDQWLNELLNDKDVCRTAQATLGLIMITETIQGGPH